MKLFCCLISILLSHAGFAVDLFGKATLTKNNLTDGSITSLSGTVGTAIEIFKNVKLEARYGMISSLQDKLELGAPVVIATVESMKTETSMIVLGLDIDIGSDKNSVQPFVYLGMGYLETKRSYYLTAGSETTYRTDPIRTGITGNLGLGFRIRLAKSIALEVEALAYASDVTKSVPIIDWSGNCGLRIFL